MEDLVKKTSEAWSKDSAFNDVMVCDPDGWDRQNFQHSWFEEAITKGEFEARLTASTCIWGIEGQLSDE